MSPLKYLNSTLESFPSAPQPQKSGFRFTQPSDPKICGFPSPQPQNPKMSPPPSPRNPICGPVPDLTIPVFSIDIQKNFFANSSSSNAGPMKGEGLLPSSYIDNIHQKKIHAQLQIKKSNTVQLHVHNKHN